jgi:ribosomal-protein-alanine N-acetyltransferase
MLTLLQKPSIRWFIRRDLDAVLEIEMFSGELLMKKEDILILLRKINVVGLVAEIDGKIVGYIIYELYKDYIHIINLVVHYDFRRKRIGETLIERIKQKIENFNKRKYIQIEVRESNLGAHLFLKKNCFKANEVKRNWFQDDVIDEIPTSTEDAYSFFYEANNG